MQNWITKLLRSKPSAAIIPRPTFEVVDGDVTLDSLVHSDVCAWVAEEDVNRFLENGYTFYVDSRSSTGRCRHHAREPGARAFAFFLMAIPTSARG